jgi:hypothetical protein
MANVLLTSVARENPADNSFARGCCTRLQESFRADRFGSHRLTDDPRQADLIIFCEINEAGYYYEFVRQHPYFRAYRDKCFLFSSADRFIPFLPGIYPSIDRQNYRPDWTRSGCYLSILENPYIEFAPLTGEEPYLYSFVGSLKNAPVRRRLVKINASDGYIADTSDFALRINMSGTREEREHFWKEFADLMRSSKFALCPRGVGVGTIRLFEAMKMGRAPVVLADDWVPPDGPDWDACILRVREDDYERLPALLREREAEAAALGLAARTQWEEWFSPPVIFHRVVEWCLDIQARRRTPFAALYAAAWLQLLRPEHAKNYLRTRYHLYRERGRLVF